MRPNLALPMLVTCLSLAACDQPPVPANDTLANVATVSLPTFAVDLNGATALIEEIGGPWQGGKVKDGMRDQKTDGAIRMISAASGNAQVFSLPGGKVWQVRLISRPAKGCSESAPLNAALPKLTNALNSGQKISESDRNAIGDAFASTGSATLELPGMKVLVLGGCTQTMTLTAT